MITAIDVRHILSRTGLPHSDLVTRPTGRAVRSSIEAALERVREPVVVLDFSEIRLIDCSCADEILARLVQSWPRVFLVRGLKGHHVDPVEQVLERQHLALVMENAGALSLLGSVAARTRAAFERLALRGQAAACELAADLCWPVDEVAAALDDLHGRRLVLRARNIYQSPTTA